MPKCTSCGRSGLTLRLDFDGLCETCHQSRQAFLAAQLEKLEAFRAEYACIPSARAEANRIQRQAAESAEASLSQARAQAESIVFDARARAARIVLAARSAQPPAPWKRLPPAAFAAAAAGGFVAFDCETTGLSPQSDRLVELSAVKYVAGQRVDAFSTLINPGISIPYSATAVNHITNNMVRSAPDPASAVAVFLDFAGPLPLVAHNADFDIAFVRAAFSGPCPGFAYGDSLAIARKLLPSLSNHKLTTCLQYLGVHPGALHRAEADAEGCAAIVVRWLRYRGTLS